MCEKLSGRTVVARGERLILRRATSEDLDFIVATESDPENARFIIADTRAEHEKNMTDPDCAYIIMEEQETGRRVGFFMVMELTSPHHSQEWRRVIVNDTGKGYGREALALLMEWAFSKCGAHRVWLDCMDHNARALHVYERMGFRREGLCRDVVFAGGRYQNLFILAILDWEWRMLRASLHEEPTSRPARKSAI